MSDLIDRQAAIDAIITDKITGNALNIIIALGDGKQAETLNEACDRHAQLLNDLPATESKVGKWLAVKIIDDEADFGETDGAECSECEYTVNSYYWATIYYHYCPNCGAKMAGKESQ